MINGDYVLVVPSWFPSRVDEFNGDFNYRTVEALSSHLKQVVVYVVVDNKIKDFEEIIDIKEHITIIRRYIPKSSFKIVASIRYLIANYRLLTNIIKEKGKPLYIHTYVFFPAGIITFYFAKRLKVKNVLTEHWSIIYPDNEYSIAKRNIFFRLLLKHLLRSFDLIFSVVDALRNAIMYWAPNVKNIIIPNVVDTSLFFYKEKENSKELIFLHVSCMEAHKNPLGIIEAFESDVLNNQNVTLKLVGPIREELLNRVNSSLVLKNRVEFLGEMPNNDVAKIMQESHVLVMNSLYESQPCVILEALCCGLPVVSSDVGGISELINKENGILFKQGDLAHAIENMVSIYNKFDCQNISKQAISNYSYESVSNETMSVLQAEKIINI